jgi:hypothetical protein
MFDSPKMYGRKTPNGSDSQIQQKRGCISDAVGWFCLVYVFNLFGCFFGTFVYNRLLHLNE